MIRSLLVALLEVRTYLRDRGDLAFSLLLPIAIFALMYGAFGGQSQFHGTAHVVDEDRGGTYSALFLQRLGELPNLEVGLHTVAEAESGLERSDLLLVMYIPEGFSEKLAAGQTAQIVFRQRGNGGQEGQIVASIARGVAEGISQDLQVKREVASTLAGRNISQARIEVTVQKFLDRERESPIVGVEEKVVGVEPDLARQFLPGVITMFVLFAVTLTGRAVVEERKKGTLERLLTTRLSVGQLFTGKFLAAASRGFVQTFILLVLTLMVFRFFTPLSFVESLAITVVFSAAASSLGMLIASIARTEDQAVWISVAFTMAMTMLGGTFFAISPDTVLYTISRISINTYANDAYKMIFSQGGSLADLGLELGVMAGVALTGLLISRLVFRVTPGGR